MSSNISYKGTRWFKCDLHLHTTASLCFQDRAITAQQWVDRAIEQGLNCVAVTDHNTGLGIDEIKAAAVGKPLTIFPGVEITCDSSKVHLLVLFDTDKGSIEVGDFLVKCNVDRQMFGEQNANTIKSIFEVAKVANEVGALVIPAHIDEYNGLGSASVDILEQFYGDPSINAAQVVHKEFLNPNLQRTDYASLIAPLNEYYNNPQPPIDEATIKQWHTAVKYAVKNNLAILTFSDNPHEPKNSKHGLLGIGSHYTWIKMNEQPSLEGLRQAFLLPDYRIKNEFDSPNNPYNSPELWIKSISVLNTSITDTGSPLKIEFSPQLNTLIGGRGSGKSSILRFIRGVFNRIEDLKELSEILLDHNDFYKRETGRPKKGVLTESSVIEIEYVRNEVLHKVIASNIHTSGQQEVKIEKLNDGTGNWENVTDEGYIDFFEFEHYSQKQIYEIAQEPNALRERIDKAIEGIDKIKGERDLIKNMFLEKSAAIRTADQLLLSKGKIETRIKDLDTSIKKLQQSGIADLLKAKEKFSKEEEKINQFKNEIEQRENSLDTLASNIELADIDLSAFDAQHQAILQPLSKAVVDGFALMKTEVNKLKDETTKLKTDFDNSVNSTQWKTDYDKNVSDFNGKKLELEQEGIDAITNFEKLSQEKSDLEKELESINAKAAIREADRAERQRLQNEYLTTSKNITAKRREFLNSIIIGDKVKVNIKPFRNQTDFEIRLRRILQRDNAFQSDIDALSTLCFSGNVEQKIKEVRELFLKIRAGEDVSGIVTGFFVNLVNSLNEAQIDEIELLLPEDEIEIQYKPTSSSAFKSLSTASAGQKTTAVLTFILSYGKVPLILDQPEDDLDNRLVYELIVDRLKQAKEYRQLIVVTHNANVPVNGDAEYIVSMDTDSKTLKVLHTGTVEQVAIKKEICDVMEGGEQAFEMRSKRYRQIK